MLTSTPPEPPILLPRPLKRLIGQLVQRYTELHQHGFLYAENTLELIGRVAQNLPSAHQQLLKELPSLSRSEGYLQMMAKFYNLGISDAQLEALLDELESLGIVQSDWTLIDKDNAIEGHWTLTPLGQEIVRVLYPDRPMIPLVPEPDPTPACDNCFHHIGDESIRCLKHQDHLWSWATGEPCPSYTLTLLHSVGEMMPSKLEDYRYQLNAMLEAIEPILTPGTVDSTDIPLSDAWDWLVMTDAYNVIHYAQTLLELARNCPYPDDPQEGWTYLTKRYWVETHALVRNCASVNQQPKQPAQ